MKSQKECRNEDMIGAAVDLGSTTIAVSCTELTSRNELVSFSFPNPQSVYGADVMTRIRHCMEDKEAGIQMAELVKKALEEQLRKHLGAAIDRLCRVVISGNTVMLHILRGMSVKGLAAAPFSPVDIEYGEDTISREGGHNFTVLYPPGFSAFVGADILSGAAYLKMGQTPAYDLLVDLGTNGELLLINDKAGYGASTACGPVFDHAVAGAAYGSECIKAIAACIKRGLINSEGVIREPYFDRGIEIDKGFVIRQQNVRNFQLAKGAVYAGISCLMRRAKITAEDIGNVYISGGLGFYMDIRDAFTVKMLQDEMKGKIKVSGNTSLRGAEMLLLLEGGEKQKLLSYYAKLRNRTQCYELADLPEFQDIYMKALNF